MIALPPFQVPSDQLRPTETAFVIAGKLAKPTGASGTLKITAPLPASERSELPLTFVARTFAKILEPQIKLRGDPFSAVFAIVQERAAMVAA
jgi:hypothetical protein